VKVNPHRLSAGLESHAGFSWSESDGCEERIQTAGARANFGEVVVNTYDGGGRTGKFRGCTLRSRNPKRDGGAQTPTRSPVLESVLDREQFRFDRVPAGGIVTGALPGILDL